MEVNTTTQRNKAVRRKWQF